MNGKRIRTTLAAAVLVLSALSAPLWAQPADKPAQPADKPAPADKKDKAPGMTEDQIDKLLDNMSPEQVDSLVTEAVGEQLKVERQQVAAEIKQGLLYDDDDRDAALKLLNDKPKNTRDDNIDRTIRAFAKVDVRFGRAHKLMLAKKYKEAAEATKKLLNAKQATQLSAAQHYLYAEALMAAGETFDGVEAYREILVNMPDRISIASAAALKAAQGYEKMNRFVYAMEMYAFCVRNYPLTIDKKQAEDILAKVEEWTEVYKDPLGSVATLMGDVESRLAAVDSGKKTQETEQKIIAILDDLIQNAEDKQQPGKPSPKPGEKKGKRPGEGQGQGEGQGKGQGQGKQGGQNPTSPMQDSMLVPGAVKRPGKFSQTHDAKGDGDWSSLPPREQEKIKAKMRKLISERYRDIIKDYSTGLDEGSR